MTLPFHVVAAAMSGLVVGIVLDLLLLQKWVCSLQAGWLAYRMGAGSAQLSAAG